MKNLRSVPLTNSDDTARPAPRKDIPWGDHVLGGRRQRTTASDRTVTFAAAKRRAAKRSRA